jgi:hypothetical protein
MLLTPAANIIEFKTTHTPEERHPHKLWLWRRRHFVHHDYQHGRRNYNAGIFHNTDQLLLLVKGGIQKSSVHYTTSCKHSLVLLRIGEIIARNMLS